MRTAIVDRAIDPCGLVAEVVRSGNGATVLFVGTVRDVNAGRAVSGIEYSAYRSMAERELHDIVQEACERFGTADIVVEHRLGTLDLGEASVSIAVGHPHRGAAYDASRYVIEQLKRRVPIWKSEHYLDGTREWVDAGGGARDADRANGAGGTAQNAARGNSFDGVIPSRVPATGGRRNLP